MTYTPKHLKLWERPDHYAGAEWPDYYVLPFGVHRDSDEITESNHETALRLLSEACQAAGIDPDALPPGGRVGDPGSLWGWQSDQYVLTVESGHWAVGWVRGLYVHKAAPEAVLRLADDLCERYENYPILDEDDLSERELNAQCEAWEQSSVRERIDYIRRACCGASIFAARRNYLPEDDNGSLGQLLLGH